LLDPKAVASFLAQETTTYVRSPVSKRAVERLMGRSLVWADGEDHKRQRKYLNPAFSNPAIRKMTPVFFDSAYKAKAGWEALIDSTKSGEAVIDVQSWMNNISIDTIGIAGFSHDFKALSGANPEVQRAFETFTESKISIVDIANLLISPVFPLIDLIPTAKKNATKRLNQSLKHVGVKLLADSKKVGDQKPADKSIIGVLLEDKETDADSDSESFSAEVVDQMKLLLIAGYETTSIALSWALVDLAQNPEVQAKLREEVTQFSTADPTWEQLFNSLPYLDAVAQEVLRVHPPIPEATRMATKDDILPLSIPVRTRDGDLVNSLAIPKGTAITVSFRAINRSEAFWGPDAKEFKPERWLKEDGINGAKDIQGHRHILTFSDGPRTCIGRGFALTEFKAVLCTLVRYFKFEMQEGAAVEVARGLLPRPRVVGQEGFGLPIRVSRVVE